MKKMLLHTPEGVRDIYGKECSMKLTAENNINRIFNLYGYHNIQTPTFEFFDVFSKERGSVASKNLYKFFDREGNTLVLRPDMTPPIARAVAKYYTDVNVPVKLCYNANTYINNSELQGKLKEITQLGCELINDGSVEGEAEIIAMVVDSLKSVGLNEFLVEVGDVDFYKGLLEECGFDEDTEQELRSRIGNKNNFGVEELLESLNIKDDLKNAFLKLPQLFGSIEVLDMAQMLTANKKARAAIDRLKQLYDMLKDYGVEKYIGFDLGMLSNFNYYTGIIFKAYTYGSGDEIVAGGRYDQLAGQFGKDASAVGFAVYMDQIMLAINGRDIQLNVDYSYEVIIYEKDCRSTALKNAIDLRKQGVKVDLIGKDKDVDIEEYVQEKKADGASKVTYISENRMLSF